MNPYSDPTKHMESGEGGGVVELKSILTKYSPSRKNLALLAPNLYEVFDGCNRHLSYYKALLAAPQDPGTEREQIADNLSKIDILLKDMSWHASDLRKEIDKFLEHVDKDS